MAGPASGFASDTLRSFDVLPEAQAVPVAVLDVEVAAAVRLIADVARDLHTFRLELGVERVGIEFAEIVVERSERSVPGFPGDRDHQAIRKADRRPSPEMLDGRDDHIRVLQ